MTALGRPENEKLVPGAPTVRRTLSNMLVSGVPAIAASALMLLVPIVGKAYLDAESYAVWALASTVVTISLVLDFGAGAWATSVFASHGVPRSLGYLVRPVAITSAGCAVTGLVFAVLWHWYSMLDAFVDHADTGYGLMVAAGLAASVRAAFAVVCAACLGRALNAIRGWALLVQALLSLAVTVLLLHAGAGLYSYVIAVAASSLVVGAVAAWRLRTALVSEPASSRSEGRSGLPGYSLKQFALTRGGVTVLGITLTQFDRWVVGAVGGSHLVASYDIAVRFASAPRLLAISLSTVLIADAARIRQSRTFLTALLRRSQWILGAAVIAGTAAMALALLVVSRLEPGDALLTGVPAGMLAAMFLWFGINGVTASTSLIAIGMGRPQFELIYLVPVVLVTVLCWAWSYHSGNADLAIYGAGAALALGSLGFLWLGPRLLIAKQRGME